MNEVKVESRNDYAIYVQSEVKKAGFPNPKLEKKIIDLVMDAFDAGLSLARQDLKVQVTL